MSNTKKVVYLNERVGSRATSIYAVVDNKRLTWRSIMEHVLRYAGLDILSGEIASDQPVAEDSGAAMLGATTIRDFALAERGYGGLGIPAAKWDMQLEALNIARRYQIHGASLTADAIVASNKQITQRLGRSARSGAEWHAEAAAIAREDVNALNARLAAIQRRQRQVVNLLKTERSEHSLQDAAKDEQLNLAQGRITKLEGEVASLSEECVKLEEAFELVNRLRESLRRESELRGNAQAEARGLTVENEQLLDRAEQAEAIAHSRRDEIEQGLSTIAQLDIALKSTQQDLAEAQRVIQGYRDGDYSDRGRNYIQLERDYDLATEAHRAALEEVDSLSRALGKSEQSLIKTKIAARDLSEELASAKERVTQLEQLIGHRGLNRVADLEAQVARLETHRSSITSELTDRIDQLKGLLKIIDKAKGKLVWMSRLLRKRKADIRAAHNVIRVQGTLLQALKRKVGIYRISVILSGISVAFLLAGSLTDQPHFRSIVSKVLQLVTGS